MANRSQFPSKVDSFVELFDMPSSKFNQAKRYQELKLKPTLNQTEQNELNGLTTQLNSYIITPETWNKMADCIVNVETFFKDKVDGYINTKQAEWATYINDFAYKGVYSASVAYKFQNMVTYNGDLYLCTKNTPAGTVPTNTGYWQKISTKGDKGDVGLNTYYRGQYSATATYKVGDAVSYQGNLFYCSKDTTVGKAPTDSAYWFLFDRFIASKTAPAVQQEGLMWIEIID
ncbi:MULTISPECIES: hypothetical protein [Bacillus]|uniref:hypothetical protein n=1 Tax=Bacillus TaxID=1386 RepID=UPI000BF593FC|nr:MULTISPECIES: hypothetical protein [Bacillus]MCP1324279.1 hypothetical protein [Bacillus sp. S0628]PGA25360.1 hypothetical protein COL80_15855 [Bacillus thuringiensis]PGU82127.1 hypothetical protein COD76_11580 [Bacillus cereus]